jgi:transcriptional regulator with XRE-family HTH domain
MNDPKIKFGIAIRKRRLELELSQEKLATLVGLHRTYISEIERGKRNVSLVNIISLLSVLEIEPSCFFSKYFEDHSDGA